jgi:hypothetical protein
MVHSEGTVHETAIKLLPSNWAWCTPLQAPTPSHAHFTPTPIFSQQVCGPPHRDRPSDAGGAARARTVWARRALQWPMLGP